MRERNGEYKTQQEYHPSNFEQIAHYIIWLLGWLVKMASELDNGYSSDTQSGSDDCRILYETTEQLPAACEFGLPAAETGKDVQCKHRR